MSLDFTLDSSLRGLFREGERSCLAAAEAPPVTLNALPLPLRLCLEGALGALRPPGNST